METDDLLQSLRWRYAAKAFDPERPIADEAWDALEEALRLTPSSYGMQPWKFIVITDQATKDELIQHSYGQKQVGNCSHLLAIAVQTDVTEADVDRFMASTAETRGVDVGTMDFFRNMVVGDIVNGPRGEDIVGWGKLQAYIALGNFMTSAALLGVDCCPMEGFSPKGYDEVLGLADKGLTTAVVCPAGHRAEGDKYADLAKVRYSKEELFERV